ncbi:hypothetical protein IEN85_12965 [Pelagicoccus sp. NFK12]|uniref:Tetratricopeptide repeat protein n=1 Tax=Pelagicoccus enzymogenes TaxID=2773457 RepID=A0A927II24_9BACT|nr:hypothetical protein [Pelagicoccus enzymogenes]MBD5780404.1 hypothetical protein [Pelagicoccus enzymogenes]
MESLLIYRLAIRITVTTLLLITTGPSQAKDPLDVFELDAVSTNGKFELPEPEDWNYAQLGQLEILTDAKLSNAERLLNNFQKFADALSIVWPIASNNQRPATLIICGNNGSFKAFLPQDRQNENGYFSLFRQDEERSVIILDFERLNYDLTLHNKFLRLQVDYQRQLYREYARFLFEQTQPKLPPWLLEGNLQIIMDIDFTDRVIKLGELDTTRGTPDPAEIPPEAELVYVPAPLTDFEETASENDEFTVELEGHKEGIVTLESVIEFWTADPPFNIALARSPLLTMEELFSLSNEEYESLNPLVDLAWAKQAHAFVHLCRYGANGKLKPSFETFVRRLENEPLSEQLFEECFEMSYDSMLKKLYNHIRYPHHNYNYVKLKKDAQLQASPIAFAKATQSVIGRIKGDAQRLAGLEDAALLSYRVALAHGNPDSELLAALGVASFHEKRFERARQLLDIAVTRGTKRPSALIALARLRLDAAVASASDKPLAPEQVGDVLLPLLKARQNGSTTAELYATMAAAWELSAIPPNQVQVELISEGVLLHPQESQLALRTAQFYVAIGEIKNAKRSATLGLKHAASSEWQGRLEAFLERLPADSAQRRNES